MLKGYLATHFFNEAGFVWTRNLARLIRESTNLDLYVPQENAEINDKTENDSTITAQSIAKSDSKYLADSNILIACLDGVEIDSGVSAEIGFFSGLIESEKRLVAVPRARFIIGVYTDMRRDGSRDNRFYINLYTKGLVELNGWVVNNQSDIVTNIHKVEELIKFNDTVRRKY